MNRNVKIAIITIVALTVLAETYLYDPATAGFFPRCPLKWVTGWECPGCGATRALHALLHGEVAQALSFNYFLIITLPFLAVVSAAEMAPRRLAGVRAVVFHPAAVYSYIIMTLAWWAIRNLCAL